MIRLRPHHLLCILTYEGRGYTPTFVENFDRIVLALGKGQTAVLVGGADDVCGPLATEHRHCERESVLERDAAALGIIGELLSTPLQIGDEIVLSHEMLRTLREGYLAGREKACAGCEWYLFCGFVAEGGYQRTRLASGGKEA